jgi:uncharacterized protein (DUF4415 family)
MPKNVRNTKRSTKSKAKMTSVVRESALESFTDWARVDAKTDDDIARDIASDPDASPAWTDEMFAQATWMEPLIKTPISIRVDPDVLEFFKNAGPGYQSRMNGVLRSYMKAAQARQNKPRGIKRS